MRVTWLLLVVPSLTNHAVPKIAPKGATKRLPFWTPGTAKSLCFPLVFTANRVPEGRPNGCKIDPESDQKLCRKLAPDWQRPELLWKVIVLEKWVAQIPPNSCPYFFRPAGWTNDWIGKVSYHFHELHFSSPLALSRLWWTLLKR